MKRLLTLAGLASLISGPPVLAQPPAPATPQFIATAAQTDELERVEGRLAETHAGSPAVKDFGADMVRDHTKTTEALKGAIVRAHLPPPPPPRLTAQQQTQVDQLKGLRGREFDKAYIGQQVQTHEQALGLMQAYASGGDNPDIKQAAARTVPIIQHHLAMARKLQSSL